MKLPIFFENSKIPNILSYISPIDIWAVNIGPFVWCRGNVTQTVRQHESIHWMQQKELLFVGFFVLYAFFYLKNLIILKNGKNAYRAIAFEMEAFRHEHVENYEKIRRPYEWIRFLK